jgi:hypothetical protein
MPRKSPKSITVNANVRCLRVYPVKGTNKNVKSLKTVGLKLSKEQATHLARVLLAVTQEWEELEITARRFKKRKSDGTYPITVTTFER